MALKFQWSMHAMSSTCQAEPKPTCSIGNVISDIVGETRLHIIEAIIAGERDPKQLAA